MQLQHKKDIFINEKGESTEYDIYYIVYMGIEIKVYPKDSTAKQLLKSAFSEKEVK